MPQTQTKTKKRSSSTKSNGGGAAKKSRAKTSANRSRAQSTSSKKKGSARPSGSKRASTKRSSPSKSRQQRTSASSSRGNGSFVDKAKKPALAGGAALLGLAGVVASRGKKRKSKSLSLPRPNLKSLPRPSLDLGWVEGKAKGLGDASYRVADLTGEVAKVQKSLKDN